MKSRGEKIADGVWTALAAAWLAVFPLWQTGSYTCITRAKWEGMLLLTGITVLATLVVCVLCLVAERRLPFHWHAGQGWMLGYFALLGLAALFGAYHNQRNANGQWCVWLGSKRYEGMATQLCYMGVCLVMSLRRPKWRWVLHLCAVSLALQCAVAFAQYAGCNPLGLFPAGLSTRTNYEFQGTIGNIDMVSGYLSLVVPLLMGNFAASRRGGWDWLLAGLAGSLWTFCMEVQSGLIALALGAGLLVLWMLRCPPVRVRGMMILSGLALCLAARKMIVFPWLDGVQDVCFTGFGGGSVLLLGLSVALAALAVMLHRHTGRAWPIAGVAAFALAALAAGTVLLLLLPLDERFGGLWELREVLLGRGQDSFGSYRLGVWRQTLQMAGKHLWLGNGPGTFWFAFAEHLSQAGVSFPERFDAPHNEYLAILANAGLPALLTYVALLLCVMAGCLRAANRKQRSFCGAAALLGALLCYAAQGMFSFSICLVSPMFWAALGLAMAESVSGSGTGRADRRLCGRNRIRTAAHPKD